MNFECTKNVYSLSFYKYNLLFKHILNDDLLKYDRWFLSAMQRLINYCIIDGFVTSKFYFQVQLQNLITSKFIAHFVDEVSSWQEKLTQADQVISLWFEVQRTWCHLESIFMSSEDIKMKLPEDSERFQLIDVEFKVS